MTALHDLEEKGQKKIQKRKRGKNRTPTAEEQRFQQATSTSLVYSMVRTLHKFVYSFYFVILLIIGIVSSIPYFIYWFSADEFLYFPVRAGDGKADPDLLINYIYLLPLLLALLLFTVCYVITAIARSNVDKLNRTEEEWISHLPFKVAGYPSVLGESGNEFHIHIKYKDVMPPETSTKAIFEAMIKYLNSVDRITKERTDRVNISMQGTYWFYKKMHQLVQKVFVPTHKDHPIESITISRN